VPNSMWAKRPYGQIDKCVEAAALRKAFPEELANTYAAEEMEGRTIDHDVAERRETPPKPPAPPVPPSNVVDVDAEEITDDPVSEGIDGDGDRAADDDMVDDNTFFERLEEALAVLRDADSLEEVWSDFDALARFDGKPNGEVNQGIANAIRKRAEKRIGGGNGET
ncbi:recombinase RecT, partial [Salmonella enterica subsp. enterica serovar Paratyphi A]